MMATPAQTMVGHSTFTVETLRNGSSLADLKHEWNDLLQSTGSNCLFLTWEWLSTWWKHLSANRQLSIMAVRLGGELIALAPLCLRPRSFSCRRPFSVLEFLGNGNVGSDYLDFIVHKNYEAQALPALASHLSAERFVFNWTQLKRNCCLAAGIASKLSEKGWTVSETSTNTCPFIPTAGKSWESYLATLGAEHRYNFNRKWKRLNRDYTAQFEEVRTGEQCRESIDLVMKLHNMRWSQRGGSEAFHTPGLIAFHREFSQIALERGWLRLYVLRLDGKPAAALYGFLYGRTFYFYQSGLDPAYAKHSVGLVTMGLAIKSAMEEGAEEYDLLHGNEDYKSHWSRDSRELGRLELYPPGGLGWVYRSSAELERASRVIARRILPKSMFDRIRTTLVARQE